MFERVVKLSFEELNSHEKDIYRMFLLRERMLNMLPQYGMLVAVSSMVPFLYSASSSVSYFLEAILNSGCMPSFKRSEKHMFQKYCKSFLINLMHITK